ncbi:hypothetical protein AAC387_Pa06g2171 [Persea americana]
MEPFLRKQGMPVRLNKGVVELVSDFVVCEEGKPLSPKASRILGLRRKGLASNQTMQRGVFVKEASREVRLSLPAQQRPKRQRRRPLRFLQED